MTTNQEREMRGHLLGIGVMMISMTGLAQDRRPAPPPATAALAAVYALIAPETASVPVRTVATQEGDQLIVRVTPTDLVEESQPVRSSSPHVLEARVTRAAGEVTHLTLTGAVTPRVRLRVPAAAPEASRATALEAARYPAGAAAQVADMAGTRAWAGLGGPGTVADATLLWRPVGADVEPVWRVTVRVDRTAAVATYVATFAAVDGALMSLEREGSR
jgi:hypothetical protein